MRIVVDRDLLYDLATLVQEAKFRRLVLLDAPIHADWYWGEITDIKVTGYTND